MGAHHTLCRSKRWTLLLYCCLTKFVGWNVGASPRCFPKGTAAPWSFASPVRRNVALVRADPVIDNPDRAQWFVREQERVQIRVLPE